MTDIGNTAIRVSPNAPTEDEMNKVQDILSRAINAIVSMSQLSADVDMLRTTVQTLQSDTERLRQQNAGLDEALFQARRTRQDMETKLHATETRASDAEQDLGRYKVAVGNQAQENEKLLASLHASEQRADNAELKVMELEDQLKVHSAQLDSIREGYETIFGKPNLAPASAVQSTARAPYYSQQHSTSNEPIPVQAPIEMEPVLPEGDTAPVPADPSPTPADTSSEWRPGYTWDHAQQLYVKEDLHRV